MKHRTLLHGLSPRADAVLLIARAVTGAFLIHGVWDNLVAPARMAEFARFLAANDFPLPALAAPFSVATQFLAGALLLLGLATRWAGLIVAATFFVGWAMVHLDEPFRAQWPALALLLLGLLFATIGGGRLSLDRLLERRR